MSSLSELLMLIGKLKIHGEPHGEKVDSLDWQLETPVVSVWTNHHGQFELEKSENDLSINLIKIILFFNLLNKQKKIIIENFL